MHVAQLRQFGVAEQGVFIERHLGVQRQQVARPGHDQRVDFHDRGVKAGKGVVGGTHDVLERSDLTPGQAKAHGKVA